MLARRLDAPYDAERVFVHLYAASSHAFWLDGAVPGACGRFSFVGDGSGPLGAVVTYDVAAGQVRVVRGDEVERRRESIFEFLSGELERLRSPLPELPFDFDCGFAGYLGYELKADCEGDAAHEAPTPDAAFVFADRLIAFDHQERCTYLVCLTPSPDANQVLHLFPGELDSRHLAKEGEEWIEETSRRLESLPALPEVDPAPAQADGYEQGRLDFTLSRAPSRYLDDIAACKRFLTAGETYEVCLTNKVLGGPVGDPLALYRSLRRVNPAPYSAYLRFGELAVLSSSPERFLKIGRDRWAEARPVKGTSRRGESVAEDAALAEQLRTDPKSRAENVTIVDLLRNDLGRVCAAGSVEAPDLMRVETYETVHQLVSTVRGRLREGVGPVECVRACFPPGSMTGAPKLRTMQILDQLEGEARGPYSGAIGYFGLGGGADLSVAIRTIVAEGGSVAIGAGGAIVLDSVPEDELAEALLKARAPITAIDPKAAISFAPAPAEL